MLYFAKFLINLGGNKKQDRETVGLQQQSVGGVASFDNFDFGWISSEFLRYEISWPRKVMVSQQSEHLSGRRTKLLS